MSSPVLTTDSSGPFVNDRFVNTFQNNSASGLSAGTAVKIVAAQAVSSCSATTDNLLGVIWNSTPPGALVSVISRGEVIANADGNVAAGDLLVAGASGQVHSVGQTVIATSAGAIQPFVRGIAITANTGGAGSPVRFFLF